MSNESVESQTWREAHCAAKFTDVFKRDDVNLDLLNERLNRPFGEVDLPLRAFAFALWQQGCAIEFRNDDGVWRETEQPLWGRQMVYRLVPRREELVLPSIDWNHVAPSWRWVTCDALGASLWTHAPNPVAGHWELDCGVRISACGFASFKSGKGDWRKLIVQRPEGA